MKKSILIIVLIICNLILQAQTKKVVSVEAFTSTYCSSCSEVAAAITQLEELDIGIIEYHVRDSYEGEEAYYRASYYEVMSTPKIFIDGTLINLTGDYFNDIKKVIDERSKLTSPFIIDVAKNNIDRRYDLNIKVENVSDKDYVDCILIGALVESNISFDWFDLNELDYLMRIMLPSEKGEVFNVNSEGEYNTNVDFEVDEKWELDNLDLVLLIQEKETNEVFQTIKLPLKDIELSHNLDEEKVCLYPNPVKDIVRIEGKDIIRDIKVYDCLGNVKIVSGNIEKKSFVTDISQLSKGVYFLDIDFGTYKKTEKVVKD
ncbi:MAG: T9SS type A sorting domain-containing protein [Hyphomicrobiales bacterium]